MEDLKNKIIEDYWIRSFEKDKIISIIGMLTILDFTKFKKGNEERIKQKIRFFIDTMFFEQSDLEVMKIIDSINNIFDKYQAYLHSLPDKPSERVISEHVAEFQEWFDVLDKKYTGDDKKKLVRSICSKLRAFYQFEREYLVAQESITDRIKEIIYCEKMKNIDEEELKEEIIKPTKRFLNV